MLVLADPGGEPLEGLLGQPMAVADFLHIAVPLAIAVGRLHARELIHKDLKPANILRGHGKRRRVANGFGIASGCRASTGARATRVHRRHARLHGTGTDRTDEPLDRRPQ